MIVSQYNHCNFSSGIASRGFAKRGGARKKAPAVVIERSRATAFLYVPDCFHRDPPRLMWRRERAWLGDQQDLEMKWQQPSYLHVVDTLPRKLTCTADWQSSLFCPSSGHLSARWLQNNPCSDTRGHGDLGSSHPTSATYCRNGHLGLLLETMERRRQSQGWPLDQLLKPTLVWASMESSQYMNCLAYFRLLLQEKRNFIQELLACLSCL